MDALYIINTRNKQILLFKEFKSNENNNKLQTFLQEFNNISYSEKSPFVMIDNSIILYLSNENDSEILYVSIISEDTMVNSVYKILENINLIINTSFGNIVTVESIRDNFVQIMLMIDQYLLNGIPVINDVNVLSGLILPYGLTDKITEKVIGKAKEYDTKTLANYVREMQVSYDNYKYDNEVDNCQVLFDFNDYIEITYDKSFNQISKTCYSEIEVFSQVMTNLELNLILNIPFNIIDISLDDSVITKRKEVMKKKILDCITKHGKYTLVQFIPILNIINLPFKLNISNNNISNVAISIQIEPVQVKDTYHIIEDIKIKLKFPNSYTNSNLSVNVGDFEFCQNQKIANWTIQKIDKDSLPTLKGNLNTEEVSPIILTLSCKIDKYSISGGLVSKVVISKNPKKLNVYKGGKNSTYIKNLEIIF